MKIVKVEFGQLNTFEFNEGEFIYMSVANKLDIYALESQQAVLLLDYDSYFNLDIRKHLLNQKLAHLKIKNSSIFSPYEAIGAFLQSQDCKVEDDIQIIDIDPNYCRSFTIRFVNGRYSLKEEIKKDIKIPIRNTIATHLRRSTSQLIALEQLLETFHSNGKTFGQMAWESIAEFERGNRDVDELFMAFDYNDWADITITDLVRLKTEILRISAIDRTQPYVIVGTLSSIFSANYSPSAPSAKLRGADHLGQYCDQFFSPSPTMIALEVFSYPYLLNVPVYEANLPYQTYMTPKQIRIFDTSYLTLYYGNKPVSIETGNSPMSCIDLELRMDGNHNLLITAGSKTFLA